MAEDSARPIASPVVAPQFRLRFLVTQLWPVIISMRPKQWTKSGAVFLALIFSVNQYWQPGDPSSWLPLLWRASAAAVAFCLASGADYLVNDIKDRESDRLHPRKSRRPIASGRLSVEAAWAWAAIAAIAALLIGFAIDWRTGAVVFAYLVLMQTYTYFLKHEVILDVMAIAAGFVLRAMAGAYAIDVPISPWLYVVTGLGALFLAITKRRAEVQLLAEDAIDHRRTLEHYTVAFVDQMTAMVTASTVIAYALYTFTADNLPSNHAMMATIPFVVYGIFRYLFLSLSRNEGGNPEEVLLKDVPLILTVIGWIVTSMVILTAYR
ncbi:MAG TPA: decaprenyl-phosphate phosphoribosyltransferase [Dehalococcoidia bacterium]|jgi:4-hydroxybenzoate polyprenyltransferase